MCLSKMRGTPEGTDNRVQGQEGPPQGGGGVRTGQEAGEEATLQQGSQRDGVQKDRADRGPHASELIKGS